jgi:D-alanine-D-alanine ligase
MNPPLRVLVLHNRPRRDPAGGPSAFLASDAGVLHEAEAVAAALDRLGVPRRVAAVSRLREVSDAIAAGDERVVFNLVESLEDGPFEAMLVPAVCQAMGRGCTGNDAVCQVLAVDKAVAKAALLGAGLAVPWGHVVAPGAPTPALPASVQRVIVKPVRADASEGIDGDSVAEAGDPASVIRAVRKVHDLTRQPALIEQFVDGREINVSILQTGNRIETLPLAEILFLDYPPDKPRIVDYAAKWHEGSFEYQNTPRALPAALDEAVADRIRAAARAAWYALGCSDYARVDFRLDAAGVPYVLEANPNPDISPDAGFAAALGAAGIPFDRFVSTVVSNAEARLRLTEAGALPQAVNDEPAPVSPAPARVTSDASVTLRWSAKTDYAPLMDLLRRTEFFHDYELDVAKEVLEGALRDGPTGHYQSFTTEVAGRVAGWVCFGPTPCTDGTYDIYWLAVDPDAQRRGLGRRLMARAEAEIATRRGRLAIVETAGRPAYESTRRFYERVGYHVAARIEDFYARGDAKIVYVKSLS